jgi:hypothetical protein
MNQYFGSDPPMNTMSTRFLSVLLMAVIFVCGFLSGRLTAPRSAALPALRESPQQRLEPVQVQDRVMRRYIEELALNPEQVEACRSLFEETGKRMLKLPKLSEERLEELERFHEALAPHLTPEQQEKARKMLEVAQRMKRPRR